MMLRPWLLAMLGLLAFSLLVWFAGPLLAIGGDVPLASPLARILVAAAFALQYVLQKLWSARQARRKNERVVLALASEQAARPTAEAAQLRERFANALQTLRRTRFGTRGGFWSSMSWKFGRQYLYQIPWYMIIGAPGTGKTTALLNSGLNFPLADSLGRGSVKGVAGTRNCDWWFTDRAVLIDTAGRYTTHESDRVADRRAWEGFLQLLREARPRRPLNGVLVAVSVTDLVSFNSKQLAEHALTLRTRLDELQIALGIRIPVYLLLTKCDLLVGFVDWFLELDRRDRDQVWGVTFDFSASDAGSAADDFAESFDRLTARLADGLLDRLNSERDPQRRARIFALPRQLRGLRERLDDLVRGVFCPRAEQPHASTTCLRGVYFTSGTQEGTPIDRMLSAFGRELGLERQILPPNQNTGKSFFLARLLSEVVFAEAEFAGHTPSRQRWQRRLILASMVAMQLAAVALAATWVIGYSRSADEIARIGSEVAQARAVLDKIPPPGGMDPRALLPEMNAVRGLALANLRPRPAAPAPLLDLGAGAHRKLVAAMRQAYDRMLLGPMLEQIARGIDALLRGGADLNLQYEALKAYTMLNDASHFDAVALKAFVTLYWDSVSAPPLTASERAQLVQHLDALLTAGAVGSGTVSDAALVESVRNRLRGQSTAQRVATRLEAVLGSEPYADFTIASVGPASGELFVGADGRSPPRAVPGRYTLEAYRKGVVAVVPAVAEQLSSEAGWVLGAAAFNAGASLTPTPEQVGSEVLALYRTSYARAWSDFVEDLRLKRAVGNDEAVRQAQALGARDGPLATLLESIVRQTTLDTQTGTKDGNGSGRPVSERFEALREFVSVGGEGRSPLDAALNSFNELRALRAPSATNGLTGDTATTSRERLVRIRADARRDPEPVRSILLALAVLPSPRAAPALASERTTATAGATSVLSRQIASRIGALCNQSVPGRYPFDRGTAREISLGDFARLFAPTEAFDQVYRQLLAPHVDTSSDPWVLRDPDAGLDAMQLERFRAAARIREVFFSGGRAQPALRLTFHPLDMDVAIDRFELEIDGQKVAYAHGPPIATVVNWPGPHGGARVEVTPPAEGSSSLAYSGPWAMFRLFDRVAMQSTASPARFRVIFNVGGARASFEVESDSGINPFRLPELERFDCPPAS